MKKLFLLSLLSICFFIDLQGDENSSKQNPSDNKNNLPIQPKNEAPKFIEPTQKIGSSSHSDLLKGFSPIQFLLGAYTPSLQDSKKIQNLAMKELKQFGQVVPKQFPV